MPKGAAENRPLKLIENKNLKKKYLTLQKTKGTIDISNSFDKSKDLSYVDGVHYSPSANKILAGRIYGVIKDKFYGK